MQHCVDFHEFFTCQIFVRKIVELGVVVIVREADGDSREGDRGDVILEGNKKKKATFTIHFDAMNFGDNIFGGINFGEISTIHRISIEIRSLKIFGVTYFRLGSSSPKLFHTEIYRK